MKNQKLFEMIEKFAALSDKQTINDEFQAQRELLDNFYEKLEINLKHIRSELEGEIRTLKERNFDPKMFNLLLKVYHNIINIYKGIIPEKPYVAAEKLVQYVLDKPTAPYIDNLNFLAKHHLQKTNVDIKQNDNAGHSEMHSLERLKQLAIELRTFMRQHPLINIPDSIVPIAPTMPSTVKNVESLQPGQNNITNPDLVHLLRKSNNLH